ncbi:MAG: hypothetical protein J6W17_01070, partial [Campylobacter sp.]|nr:hypothetical protein [Campylobacter sp.]
IAKNCTENFIDELKSIFKNQEIVLKQKEKDLQEMLNLTGVDTLNSAKLAKDLESQISEVLSIKQRILV